MSESINIHSIFSGRAARYLLITAWALMQATVFYQYGIVTELEAHKYIEQADNLIQSGTVSTPNFWLYSTQIFLIAAAKWLHTGYGIIVIIQMLLNGLATFQLYRFSRKITNDQTGFIIILLLILNWPFQSFNSFLYTESIFFSLTILYSIYLLQLKKPDIKSISVVIVFLALLCVTRPAGLLLFPCTVCFFLIRFATKLNTITKLLLTGSATFVFIFLLNIFLGSGGEFDFMLPFREEHIICGVPTINNNGLISGYSSSTEGIVQYILHHPGQFSRLAISRSQVFFGLSRPYYGMGHNLYLWLYFFPLYIMVLYSIRSWWVKNRALLLYSLGIIFCTWAMVILTCDDWHNRFFLNLVPFLYILAIPGLEKFTSLLKKRK